MLDLLKLTLYSLVHHTRPIQPHFIQPPLRLRGLSQNMSRLRLEVVLADMPRTRVLVSSHILASVVGPFLLLTRALGLLHRLLLPSPHLHWKFLNEVLASLQCPHLHLFILRLRKALGWSCYSFSLLDILAAHPLSVLLSSLRRLLGCFFPHLQLALTP